MVESRAVWVDKVGALYAKHGAVGIGVGLRAEDSIGEPVHRYVRGDDAHNVSF